MPRLVSVLDSNVYRSINDGDLHRLIALERSRSVISSPCYPVVQELLAHLALDQDPDFASCYAGLSRLGAHCRRYDGQRYYLVFLADAIEQVADLLFSTYVTDPTVPAQYAELVGDIVEGECVRIGRPIAQRLLKLLIRCEAAAKCSRLPSAG